MADLHLSSYRKHAHEPDDWLKSPIASVGIATRRAFRVESQRTLESHRLTARRRKEERPYKVVKHGYRSQASHNRRPMRIMPIPGSATKRQSLDNSDLAATPMDALRALRTRLCRPSIQLLNLKTGFGPERASCGLLNNHPEPLEICRLERFSLGLNPFNLGILFSLLIWFNARWVLSEDTMDASVQPK